MKSAHMLPQREREVTISLVIPVYRGEATLRDLTSAINRTAAQWAVDPLPIILLEAIYVNDGATDNSASVLSDMLREHSWVRILTLPTNSGQHAATITGILQSRGGWVATLDEDLQHHPEKIRPMLAHAIANRLDLVYARPSEAVHQSLFRDGSSWLIKTVLAFLTGNSRIPDFNSFRLIRGEVARAAAAAAGERPYFDITLCDFAGSSGTCTMRMKDRRYIEHQSSGWTPLALLAHARRMLIVSNSRRARALAIAILPTALSVSVLAHSVVQHERVSSRRLGSPGRACLSLALSVFATLMVGLSLDYLISNWRHSKRYPKRLRRVHSKDERLGC